MPVLSNKKRPLAAATPASSTTSSSSSSSSSSSTSSSKRARQAQALPPLEIGLVSAGELYRRLSAGQTETEAKEERQEGGDEEGESRTGPPSPRDPKSPTRERVVLVEAGATPEPAVPGNGIPGATYFNAHELEIWPEWDKRDDADAADAAGAAARSLGEEEEQQKSFPEGSGNLKPFPELQKVIASLDIRVGDHVIVYFRRHNLHNHPISACRLIWALAVVGIRKLTLLDGGLLAWTTGGYPTAPMARRRSSSSASDDDRDAGGARPERRPRRCYHHHREYVATTELVEGSLRAFLGDRKTSAEGDEAKLVGGDGGRRNLTLADVRSWGEHTGVRQKYTFMDAKGRIPSSKWARWGPGTYKGGDYWESENGLLRSLKLIEKMWKDEGILRPEGPNDLVVFYCGSGWRSSLAWVISKLLGWENTMNYDGGWFEWTTTHKNASRHRIEILGPVEPPPPPPFLLPEDKDACQ